MSQRLGYKTMNDLINWILTEGRFVQKCPRINSSFGIGTSKETMYLDLVGTKVLHPQATGYTWIWENEEVEESIISYVYAMQIRRK